MSAAPQIDWSKIPGAKVVAASASPAPVDWSKVPGARVVTPAPTATVSAAPPAGLLHPEQWLENVANDLRYGGTSTWVGRAAKAAGAQPLYSGVSPHVAEFMGGPELGIPKAAKGALETVSGHLLKGPSDVISGVAQAVTPIAGATQPEFLPGAAKAIGAATAISGAARAVGASPETAAELGNIGTAAGLEAERRLGGATAKEAVTQPVETTANAASAGASAVGSAATAARDSAVGNAAAGMRPQAVDPVSGMVRALRARNSIRNFPKAVETALPDVRRALDTLSIDPSQMSARDLEAGIARAKADVWDEFTANHYGPNASFVLPTDYVANAIQASADKMAAVTQAENPAIIKAISDTADLYRGQRMPISQIEARIQDLNNELRSAQSTFKVNRDALAANPQYAYRFAELNALRSVEANAFNTLSGPGAGALKQRYGALKVMQDVADRQVPVIERAAQQRLYGGLGKLVAGRDIAAGAWEALTGHMDAAGRRAAEAAAEFQVGRNIQQMNDPEFLLRASLSNTTPRPAPTLQTPGTAAPPPAQPLALPPAPMEIAHPGNPNPIPPKAFLGGGLVRDPATGKMMRVQTQEVPLSQSPLVAPNPVPEGVTVRLGKGYRIARDPKTGRMVKIKQ